MPDQDATRWNARYLQDARYATFTAARPFLVEHAVYLPHSGLALDVAMGLGGNAGFLLDCGLQVVGVDISWVALQQAKARLPHLQAVLADLTNFYLPEARFDVILNFYYLQRTLWPQFQRALRPSGLLVIETLTRAMLDSHPDFDPDFLLKPGELRQAFSNWQILVYHEGWVGRDTDHPRAVASLIARLP